jgi:hypothetical protein
LLRGQELVEEAKKISRIDHAGQKYGDFDFFDHPLSVAKLAVSYGYNHETEAACYLHDTVEDTEETFERLLSRGITGIVVDAVASVTYIKGEETADKIEKARSNPIGHVVKFLDSSRNFSRTTWPEEVMSPELRLRRTERYNRNIGLLLPGLPTPEEIRRFTKDYYREQQVA